MQVELDDCLTASVHVENSKGSIITRIIHSMCQAFTAPTFHRISVTVDYWNRRGGAQDALELLEALHQMQHFTLALESETDGVAQHILDLLSRQQSERWLAPKLSSITLLNDCADFWDVLLDMVQNRVAAQDEVQGERPSLIRKVALELDSRRHKATPERIQTFKALRAVVGSGVTCQVLEKTLRQASTEAL